MAIYRVTFGFNFFIGGSFSTNWYAEFASPPDLGGNTKADKLAGKLLGCMTNKVFLAFMRASPITNFRLNRLATFGENYPGYLNAPMAEKNDCVIFLYNAANGTSPFALRYLHGIPKSVIGASGTLIKEAKYLQAAQALAAQLVADNWGWLGQTAKASSSIATIASVVGQNTIAFGMVDNVFPNTPGKIVPVFVSGVRGAAILNRQLRVRIVDEKNCVTTKPYPILAYTGGGKLTYSTKGIVTPADNQTTGAMYGLGTRKTGRTFFQSRGRRPVQKVA